MNNERRSNQKISVGLSMPHKGLSDQVIIEIIHGVRDVLISIIIGRNSTLNNK